MDRLLYKRELRNAHCTEEQGIRELDHGRSEAKNVAVKTRDAPFR
jgi:hypothetical protein